MEEDAEFWKRPGSASGSAAAAAAGKEHMRSRRYLPFGDGVRSCIGLSLAKMNYTATVALLLSHFTFRLADRVSPPGHCRSCMQRRSCAYMFTCKTQARSERLLVRIQAGTKKMD
jgi:fatty acid synthase